MLLRLSFISLIIWFIYMIPSQFLNLDIFKIKKINIGENSKILNEELSAVAEKIYDKSIWQIDMKKLKQELSKDIRLESVEISHDKVGELNFKVEEKELLYYAQIGERIYLMDKKGNKSSYNSDNYCLDMPLVVLVDEYSASSSEILTVALKDNDAATIVGKTTFGKGIVQIMIPLSDGSFYKYTYQQYYGPAGDSIHGKGITPDVEAELPEEYQNVLISDIPYENDTQLQKAVEVMEEKIGRE